MIVDRFKNHPFRYQITKEENGKLISKMEVEHYTPALKDIIDYWEERGKKEGFICNVTKLSVQDGVLKVTVRKLYPEIQQKLPL